MTADTLPLLPGSGFYLPNWLNLIQEASESPEDELSPSVTEDMEATSVPAGDTEQLCVTAVTAEGSSTVCLLIRACMDTQEHV